ncbi:MAG: CBS domain-containing protein [Actinomycetota bacterium]
MDKPIEKENIVDTILEQAFRSGIFSVETGDPVLVAAQQMIRQRVSSLGVLSDGVLTGLITERDLARVVSTRDDPRLALVGDYATEVLIAAEVTSHPDEILRRMRSLDLRHMPVVEDDRIIGIISMRGLLAGMRRRATAA